MDKIIDLFKDALDITGPWLVILAVLVYIVNQVVSLNFNKRGLVFAKLHEERAVVIKEMFQKLTVLFQTLSDFTRGHNLVDGDKTVEEYLRELANSFEKSYVDTKNYFALHRIYLSYDLCDKIEKLLSNSFYSGSDYATFDRMVRESWHERNMQDYNDYKKECRAIRDEVEVDISRLLEDIELEFRNLVHGKSEGRKRRYQLWQKHVKHRVCNLKLVKKIKSTLSKFRLHPHA